MGNREALIEGAKRCLQEKGYAGTTARDIAGASGVSLAAIGYHFGSKEALLQAALFEAMRQWGDELRASFQASPGASFEERWRLILASFEQHRPFWLMQFEMVVQSERTPELRRVLAEGVAEARQGLAEMFDTDPELGAVLQVLLGGVLMQWLVDPETAITARELTEGLARLRG